MRGVLMRVVIYESSGIYSYVPPQMWTNWLGTDIGAGYVQLWIRSTELPGEHRYEN